MKRTLAGLLALLVLVGCSSTPLESIPVWRKPKVDTKSPDFVALTAPQKSAFEKEAVEKERNDYLARLKKSFEQVMYAAQSTLDGLARKADRYSKVDLGIGLSGVVSGVAAAILVVASPANAATVAGLTAWGAGATGYQTSLASAGFSREIIAKVHQDLYVKITTQVAAYNDAYLKLDVTVDDSVWEENARKAEAALAQIISLAMLVPMGEVPPKPAEKPAEARPKVEETTVEVPKPPDVVEK